MRVLLMLDLLSVVALFGVVFSIQVAQQFKIGTINGKLTGIEDKVNLMFVKMFKDTNGEDMSELKRLADNIEKLMKEKVNLR